MKLYIVKEMDEYKVFKVPDNLIAEFEDLKKDQIVVNERNIQEALAAFDGITKQEGMEFNAKLIKFKSMESKKERI